MYKQKLARALFLEEQKFGERLTHGHKGEFTSKEVKNVFKNLGNPRYIFNSKNNMTNPNDYYLIGVFDELDTNKEPMVISLHFNKNRKEVEANWITSIYGKRKNVLVNDWTQKGYLVYMNDLEMEKAPAEVVTLQMRVSKSASAYIDNVMLKSKLVNDLDIAFFVQDNQTYGFAHNGKIYLNPDTLGTEVAVHEYTHLWDNLIQKDNPELWNKGLEIFKGTSIWNEVVNDEHYADIKEDENLVLSECHALITGKVAKAALRKIAEVDGTEKQADMIDWDKETINFIFENYRDVFAKNGFETVAEFAAASMKELFMPTNERRVNPIDPIQEMLEKASGIKVSPKIADEIFSRFQENGLDLRIKNKDTFDVYDEINDKITTIGIQEAVKQVISWDDKELLLWHEQAADDKIIEEIKNNIADLENLDEQITHTKKLNTLDFQNISDVEIIQEFLSDEGFKSDFNEAQALLAFATNFNDGTSQYAVNNNSQLYFKTKNDDYGWMFIPQDDHAYGAELVDDAFVHAITLLESDQSDYIKSFKSFVEKNENLIKSPDLIKPLDESYKQFIEKLEELSMEKNMEKNMLSFIDDEEKMRDFAKISREDFLSSYSYLSEEEYDATAMDFNNLKQSAVQSLFSDTIKTVEDVNKVYDNNLDFIESNVSFKESNPEYNEIDEIEKWKNGELFIPVADSSGNFTNDMEANTLADYNQYSGKNFKSYSELIEYQANLKAKLLDSAIENSITEYLRREYAETSPNSGTFEVTVENQSYPIDEDELNIIANKDGKNNWNWAGDRLDYVVDRRFEEDIEQKENDIVAEVVEYIAAQTDGNLVLKESDLRDFLIADEKIQIYAPKEEFLAIQPESVKQTLMEAGIAKEELYNNVETMTVSEKARNEMLSASFAGSGGLTQKAFADSGIEIDLATANALENCFSQIEAMTKYTADGHDLFHKGNGLDTISEQSIEYSEEDKAWFVHEKNWLALSAVKGEEAEPEDYMEKADRVGDRNWAINCEELVKYVYQEIKEDGEMEKEFPDTFRKLENLNEYLESLTEAKELISDFCFDEYMSTPTFDDLKDVGLAYTTFEDPYTHEEYEVQTSADLVNSKITTKINDKIADVSEYNNLKEMVVDSLNNLDFDSLVYVPASKIDVLLKEEREDIEKNLLEKASQIISETFNEPSLAKRAKLYIPSDYGYEADNKIHILVEFDNKAEREDDLFNALAERHLVLANGKEVDFNPIKPEKSGTIEQYLDMLNKTREENKNRQKRKEDYLSRVKVTSENFREVFNEVIKTPRFKDKPLEAAGWCFSKVSKENKAEVGKWLSDLGCGTKKDSEKLFNKWNRENNPRPNVTKSKSNEKDDWSISD